MLKRSHLVAALLGAAVGAGPSALVGLEVLAAPAGPVDLCRTVDSVDAQIGPYDPETGVTFSTDINVCRAGHRYTVDLAPGVKLNGGTTGPGNDVWQVGPSRVRVASRTPTTVLKVASAKLVDFRHGLYPVCYRASARVAMNTLNGNLLTSLQNDVVGVPCIA